MTHQSTEPATCPAPVITTERITGSYGSSDDDFVMSVVVGGVSVMTRTYVSDPAFRGQPHHVEDLEGAQSRVLTAFRLKMQEVFGGGGW